MNKITIGKRIKELRKMKRLSQKELADLVGVSDKAVSKWENDISFPSIENIYKICKCLNTTFEKVIIGTQDNKKKSNNSGMKSIKELFKVGRGPSSSHTIGPEKICRIFKNKNIDADKFKVVLYGSLAQTGIGHGTDTVIKKTLHPQKVEVEFDYFKKDIKHPNTMEIFAYKSGKEIDHLMAYSVGGGAVRIDNMDLMEDKTCYRYSSFKEIAEYCIKNNCRLWEYVIEEEGEGIWDFLKYIWNQMKESISRGLEDDGILPGGLNVQKKAKVLYRQHHIDETAETKQNRLVCAYAFAVSEQNASGETIVTAPTCGSSGVVPATLYYFYKKGFDEESILKALATASIIGNLVKTNASISGAECGCQAEIGTACAMAAAALAELFEMEIEQIEYSSEIAIEHHLGLTCDPINGLVQIPCIERNAVAAMRAINAVSLANFLTDTRKISLDLIIQTMYDTGKDLPYEYRESSIGGLAKLYN